MRSGLRPVAFTLAGLLGMWGVWLTWTVTAGAAQYRDDPRNVRTLAGPADPSRGRILSADGVVLAEDGPDGERVYPEGASYAHLVGFDAPSGRSGIEATRYGALQSRDDGSITAWLRGLLGDDLGPPDARLTVVDELQRAAVASLGDRPGAIVVIDPRTGAVLAYASSPPFDPVAVVDGEVDLADQEVADALVDLAADRILPPGSTFKVVVAAAALDAGLHLESVIPAGSSYTPPTGEPIGNFGGGGCGGDPITLTDALAVSCNTAFARLAVDLGGEPVAAAAQRAGFNSPLPWETGAAVSSIPPGEELDDDLPALAQTGLGERDVRATPLLMATIAAAIANEGIAMAPFVVDAVVAPDGEVLEAAAPERLGRMFSAGAAADLVQMMVEVVARGTGQPAAVAGVEVAGKTGTAEGGGGPHAWFIGFAPADDPAMAVAVLVEGGGSGGRVAGPIAAAVIAAWLGAG
jgi:peptidoglycan glycosyltransferase